MLAPLVTLMLVAVPAGHQVVWHNGLRKVLRATLPRSHRGPELPPTAHELHHRERSLRLRVAIELGWAVYLAGAVLAGMTIR
jgi:hypothetical protein